MFFYHNNDNDDYDESTGNLDGGGVTSEVGVGGKKSEEVELSSSQPRKTMCATAGPQACFLSVVHSYGISKRKLNKCKFWFK